jgi:glycosyltransferase involved in cell wall biosynthesis
VRRVRDRLELDEASGLRATVGDDVLLDAARLDELGVTLLGETLDRARSVIVSSEQAAATVRGIRPAGPPMLILPLGHPPVVAPDRTPQRRDIVAVGWLARNKSPALAIEVLALLPTDVTLTFVGPSAGDTADEVRRLAENVGVHGRVAFTGRLEDDEYEARIAASRVGLQLRSGDRGEMSAAVTDLLAHGIPTVTTLATAGPSTPGLRVVEAAADALVAAIEPLLGDDEWERSSADALARAGRWTFDHVAEALLAWLDDAAGLPPATVRRAGAASVSAAP